MIRTKFYDWRNVLSLRVERKRRKLMLRKEQRDQLRHTTKPEDYLLGLMICMDRAYLTKADKALCDRLYALEPGDKVTREDKHSLHKLIGRLMADPWSVIVYKAHPDDVDDGRYALVQKRKVA